MIVDANVILCAFFPDEAQARAQSAIRQHVAGRIQLKVPSLLPYELTNAVWQAERRGRISPSQSDEILQAIGEQLFLLERKITFAEIIDITEQCE